MSLFGRKAHVHPSPFKVASVNPTHTTISATTEILDVLARIETLGGPGESLQLFCRGRFGCEFVHVGKRASVGTNTLIQGSNVLPCFSRNEIVWDTISAYNRLQTKDSNGRTFFRCPSKIFMRLPEPKQTRWCKEEALRR